MLQKISQMPREIHTPIEVILMVTSGEYDNIVLFGDGDHEPLDAINYIIYNCNNDDILRVKEFEPRTLNVW